LLQQGQVARMRLDKDVTRLLATHGYDLTLSRRLDGGSYSTTTGKVSGGTTTTETVRGMFINYMEEEVNGTSITADDRKLILRAQGMTMVPETGDFVDNEVRILDVRKIQSGATVIAYICQTRG